MGGYFTLDATVIPDQPGLLELVINVNYTDDFNQPQIITQTLTIDVAEAPAVEPGLGPGGMPETPSPSKPETFWHKVGRFLLGLLGLDSGRPQQSGGSATPENQPIEKIPVEPVPVSPPPKG
jgi:hypothetical protein